MAMSGIATDRSPSFSLPLRYFLLGVASYLLTMTGVAAFGGELAGTTWSPHLLALTHLLTLGTVLSVIMGATYQLVPVVLLASVWSQGLGKATFWVYLAGVVGMVAGFWTWAPMLLAAGGTLVVLAILSFLVNVAASLARGATWNRIGLAMVVALVMLVAAGTVGALRVAAYARPGLAVPMAHALAAHAHLAAFGCAALFVFGLSYQMITMFVVTHGHDRLGWPVLVAGTLGITAFAAGGLGQLPWLWRGGAVLMAASSWLWAYDVWRMYRGRTRKALDVGLTLVASAVPYLLAATVLGLMLAFGATPGLSAAGLAAAYAVVGLVGFLVFTIVGWLYKIMPFLSWYHRYSTLVGKQKVPMIKDLFDERTARAGFWLSHAGVLAIALCLIFRFGPGVQVGGLLAALGAATVQLMLIQTLRR